MFAFQLPILSLKFNAAEGDCQSSETCHIWWPIKSYECDIWFLSCSCWRTKLSVVEMILAFTEMFCYYLAKQLLSFPRLCHLHIVQELINSSGISCLHLWSYSRHIYHLNPDEESLKCFIWLCKMPLVIQLSSCAVHFQGSSSFITKLI